MENLSKEELFKIIEEAGNEIDWGVKWDSALTYLEFINNSPEGEDISFDLNSEEINTLESVIHDLYEYWEDFNAYDHAVMWYQTEGKYGGPTDLRILIDDAENIKDMYYKLYKKISETVHLY